MKPDAVRKLQAQLGVPQTGTFDAATSAAMSRAVSAAVSSNRDVARYAGGSGADAILSAYMSGDWAGVTDLSGKPFTDQQQQAAAREAERVLAPAYRAEESFDRAVVEDDLAAQAGDLSRFRRDEATAFGDSKRTLDQGAADRGVLFAGSRLQDQRRLSQAYANRDADAAGRAAGNIGSIARAHQYAYGNEGAEKISERYQLPGASRFDAGVAGGKVAPAKSMASVYSPGQFSFQGTKPVAQKAAIQTRAANQLANRANKLSIAGYGTKL